MPHTSAASNILRKGMFGFTLTVMSVRVMSSGEPGPKRPTLTVVVDDQVQLWFDVFVL